MKKLTVAFCCAVLLVLTGCARAPILKKDEKIQIVEVLVTTHERFVGSANFPEEVRYVTQNEAYKFSEEGREKKLHVLLKTMKKADPARAVLTGSGSSVVRTTATLIDVKTGAPERKFGARGSIFRLAAEAVHFSIVADEIDYILEEKNLAKSLADELMTRIYGKEYASTIVDRQPKRSAKPNYPMSWKDAGRKFKCEQIQSANEAATPRDKENNSSSTNSGGEPFIVALPDYCGTYLK